MRKTLRTGLSMPLVARSRNPSKYGWSSNSNAAETVLDEVAQDPLRSRAIRAGYLGAADLRRRQRPLQTIRREVVERHELFRRAVPVADVGLVPDLPPPAFDFAPPVFIDRVLHP